MVCYPMSMPFYTPFTYDITSGYSLVCYEYDMIRPLMSVYTPKRAISMTNIHKVITVNLNLFNVQYTLIKH